MLNFLEKIGILIVDTLNLLNVNTKIQKWGNSLALRIPKSFAKSVDIDEGNEVSLQIINKKIIIQKQKKKKTIRLKNLLASVTKENIHKEIDSGSPIGNEIW